MAVIGINTGVGIGLAGAELAGNRFRLDPYLACHFVVEVEGLLVGGFAECAGLEVETEMTSYREGGVNGFVRQFVGPAKYPPLVLKRGLSPIDGLWNWHQDIVAGTVKRRNGTIYLLNHQGMPVVWWHFSSALPIKWTGPSLNAMTGAIAFESVELIHEGLTHGKAATRAAGIAGEVVTNVFGSGPFF